ncbi:hypothetical protein WICPIJ_002182 [Wickerhamomyces pijperi]|uniref:Uncharacterized protein n=1 Tax=Wickerhamomyces pijperi TaxID=599730 RepID=A0A9P8TQ25_WICPI|nr:hypothetical protein WICPIJ_002182 [Wickerhamomyces pijperi]
METVSNPTPSNLETTKSNGVEASAPGKMYLFMNNPQIKSSYCQDFLKPAYCKKKIPSSSNMSYTCSRKEPNFLTPTCSAISKHVILLYLPSGTGVSL